MDRLHATWIFWYDCTWPCFRVRKKFAACELGQANGFFRSFFVRALRKFYGFFCASRQNHSTKPILLIWNFEISWRVPLYNNREQLHLTESTHVPWSGV